MTDWKALELKPFNLDAVPSDLEWCVYPEEKERGEVYLPEPIYMIVLALRWILTYTQLGPEADFETWKVYWKTEGKYGFRTSIFLSREKVEQYESWNDEYQVQQEQTWTQLALLECSNGMGVISDVHLSSGRPYDKGSWRLDGAMGVRRLLEDAILASHANHNFYPFNQQGDYITTRRVASSLQEADGETLGFKLVCDHKRVTAIDLKVWPDPRW